LAGKDSTIAHLTEDLTEAEATIRRMTQTHIECIANLDDAEARVERLWAQLNEATNTPHNDPEFGFDKTAALSDPGEDVAALTWLEIGAATREGIAKEIESQMQFEGVRAQRVMGMCAGIARTWKP